MPSAAPAAWTLAAGTLLSRLLGFARDLLFAWLLGPAADAFLVAFRLPNMARRMLAEGTLGLSYGAAIGRMLARSGPGAPVRDGSEDRPCGNGGRDARTVADFGRAVGVRLCLAGLPLTAAVALLARPLVFLLAPGLESGALAHAATMLRLCALYLPFALLAAIACAHAAALGNFRPQARSSVLFNLIVIAVGLAAALFCNSEDARFAVRTAFALCWALPLAGLVQVLAALHSIKTPGKDPGAAALLHSLRQSAAAALLPVPPEASALLRSLPRDIAGAAPHVLHLVTGTVLASFLAQGGVSALYFAERLVELPLGLFGAAFGLAALPALAGMAARGEAESFSRHLGKSIGLTAFFSLPATAGLFALAGPVCGLLFGHGAFAGHGAALTATVLSGSCLGLPALCASRPLLAAANAVGANTLRAACASLAPLVLIATGGLIVFGGESREAAFCLGLGLALAAWANAALLLRLLRDRGLPPPLKTRRPVLCGYALAAAIMAGGLLLLDALAGPLPSWALLALVVFCAALWGGGALLFGNEDARVLWQWIRKR